MRIYDEWGGGNVNYFVYDVCDAVADDGCCDGDGGEVVAGVVALVRMPKSRRRRLHCCCYYRHQVPAHRQGHDGVHDGHGGDGYRDHRQLHGGGHDNR